MPGAFCVSIDLELAWGARHRLTGADVERAAALDRVIVDGLLALFRERGLSATWAIVGHLLEPCRERPEQEKAAWLAPEIIEKISTAAPRQEIGSHSYAHVSYAQPEPAAVKKDLENARRVHREHGLAFDSFVFPRNEIGHVELLAAAGIKVCRTLDAAWHKDVDRWDERLGRLAHLADYLLPVPPPVVAPHARADGLVELPSSMLWIGRGGARSWIPPVFLETKAIRGLDRAAATGRLFHLWFHPSNFYEETAAHLASLGRVLTYAARLRDQGRIEVRTMGSYALSAC